MSTFTVYWLHEPQHIDPFTEGYVGVTKRDPKLRLGEHMNPNRRLKRRKPIPAGALLTILHTTPDQEEAYLIEQKYRPQPNIAWNSSIGGQICTRPPGIHTSGWKHSAASKRNHSLGQTGEKNSQYGRTGAAHPRSQLFVLNGKSYNTLKEASDDLGLTESQVNTLKQKAIHGPGPGKATGARNHWSRAVIVEGIRYNTMTAAAFASGVARGTIRKRIAQGVYHYVT